MDSTNLEKLITAARALDAQWRTRWAELNEQFGGSIPTGIEDQVLDGIEDDLLKVERRLDSMGVVLIDLLDASMLERGPVA